MNPTGFSSIAEALAAVELKAAIAAVWPYVGNLCEGCATPDDVYRLALIHMKQDVSHVQPGEYHGVFSLLKSEMHDNHKAPLHGVMPGAKRKYAA
jgi:hypothetical protein